MRYTAAHGAKWLHPDDHKPPKGSNIWMLTEYGRSVEGNWQCGMAAWMPKPKLDDELEERLRREGRLK